MGKSITYFCDHCKKKLEEGTNKVDIVSKSLSLFNCYNKNFREELYFCDKCFFELRDKLEAFVHRRFSFGR